VIVATVEGFKYCRPLRVVIVDSPDNLLETIKEKGKNTLVESPCKLVRKGL
jgi:hypothetical protein